MIGWSRPIGRRRSNEWVEQVIGRRRSIDRVQQVIRRRRSNKRIEQASSTTAAIAE